MTRDAVVAARRVIGRRRRGSEVMLAGVVQHDHRIAIRVVNAMQRRAHRRHAERDEQQPRRESQQRRGHAQQLRHQVRVGARFRAVKLSVTSAAWGRRARGVDIPQMAGWLHA